MSELFKAIALEAACRLRWGKFGNPTKRQSFNSSISSTAIALGASEWYYSPAVWPWQILNYAERMPEPYMLDMFNLALVAWYARDIDTLIVQELE